MPGSRSPRQEIETIAPVVDWLRSDDGRAEIRDRLTRCGFVPTPVLVDEVLTESCLVAMAATRLEPAVDAPGDAALSRARRAVKDVVDDLSRPRHVAGVVAGMFGPRLTGIGGRSPSAGLLHEGTIDERTVDGLRALVDAGNPPEWLTAAVLAYLAFHVDPDAVPDDVPAAVVGADKSSDAVDGHPLAWSALWATGSGEAFPEPGPDLGRGHGHGPVQRLLARLDELADRHRLELWSHGAAAGPRHRGEEQRPASNDSGQRADGDDG